jgi:hypothetical protein
MIQVNRMNVVTQFTTLLGLCLGFVACSAGQTNEGADGTSEGTQLAEGAQFEDHTELLSASLSACSQYEAENVGRTGGMGVPGGWKLTNATDNINQTRMFATGTHVFSIYAKGAAGGGQNPQIKLTLNGIQIGGNVSVTNTTSTATWKEYVVSYSISTGNNKTIKVELANPGSGRSLSVDGINVYCPRPKVVCGSNLSCDNCCYASTGGSFSCNAETCNGQSGHPVWCDQNSDCSTGEVCANRGNPFNGFGIGCTPANDCVWNPQGQGCAEICKTPGGPELPCPAGKSCQDAVLGEFYNYVGWKQCVGN